MSDTPPERGRDAARRIMDAAVRLFARKGFAATTTREIVEAAGVTKPMLYYYFGSKEGVCRAAIDAYVQDAKQALERILQDVSDPRVKLVEVVWMAFRFHRQNPEFFRMAMALFYGPKGEVPGVDLTTPAQEVGSLFRRVVQSTSDGGLVRPERVEALLRLVDGMIIGWTRSPILGEGPALTRELAEQLVDDLLGGFARR